MATPLKIPVSFKQRELNLYLYCMGKVSPSAYIKELIIKDMEGKRNDKER